jgi:hypothetical protein
LSTRLIGLSDYAVAYIIDAAGIIDYHAVGATADHTPDELAHAAARGFLLTGPITSSAVLRSDIDRLIAAGLWLPPARHHDPGDLMEAASRRGTCGMKV